MLDSSCASFSSKITVPVPLPVQNPYRTLLRRTLKLRQVLVIASTTFHRDSIRPIPWMTAFSFIIRTMITHPSYPGISLCFHMNWKVSTSFFHHSGMGGFDVSSAGYAP